MSTNSNAQFDIAEYEKWDVAAKHKLQEIIHQLRSERIRRKISQRQLGALLDIPQPRISEIERMNGEVSLMRICLIAAALGMELLLTDLEKT